jgi:glycosyltransferase involved in cell wall biosynthesis
MSAADPPRAGAPIFSVHVAPDLDAEASGPSHSVTGLARGLMRSGAPAVTFSLSARAGVSDVDGLSMHRFAPGHAPVLRALGASRALRLALRDSPADVFHIHGLWRMANVYPADAARARGAPVFVSPRGMLGMEALRFSPLRKKIFWALAQGRAVRMADALHATSEQEWRDIRAFGLRQPVALLPNGVALRAVEAPAREPYVLSLGRLHPIKGLDRLLRAWALLEADFPDWRLRMHGPSELGHRGELMALARELRLERVEIGDALYGEEKRRAFVRASLFALPSHGENFANTVAESLACGVPVVASTGAPWEGLRVHGCGWWTDNEPEAFAAALRDAMSLSHEERRAIGARGRAWMARDFSWEEIGRRMAECYAWSLGLCGPPACLRFE